MKTDVFMPLFIGDYLRDTSDLDAEEHGAYLLILIAMWTSDGSLAIDRLDRVARVSKRRWPEVWGAISRFFDIDVGRIKQRRLTRELAVAKARRESARRNGLSGGRHKREPNLPDTRQVNRPPNPGETSSPSPSPSQREEKKQIAADAAGLPYPDAFESLWIGCDRKGSKFDAHKAWVKVGRPEWGMVVSSWKRYVASLEEWRNPKDVATWLRARGYLEEYTAFTKTPVARPVVRDALMELALADTSRGLK